jgi:hypothetical protein
MTHERKRDFYFSIPILNVEQVVFYNAAHHPELGDADGLGALAALRPVRIEGYAYQPDFQRIMNDPADADDEREAFELLLDDPTVHYLPFARRVGEAMLARFFPTRRHVIQVIPDLSLNNNLHLMVSKLNPGGREFLDDFDDALARLRLAGVIDHDLRIVAGVGTGTIVELSAPPGEWVTARDPDRPQQKLLLPSGTRAALVSWGAAYTDAYAGESDAAARACLVRVITEPAGGRVLEVDGRFLRLVPGR